MKLFSRKSLVAAAASTALLAGVVAAPANAETTTETPATTSSSSEAPDPSELEESPETDEPAVTPEPEEGSSEQLSSGSSEDGELDPGQIRDWVAVFTAIIGALSTVFVFMERMN